MRRVRDHLPVALVAVLAIVVVRVMAQNVNEVDVEFHAFQDSRGVTVLTPSADLMKDFTNRTSLRLNVNVDAISAASDSCARCHRDGINSHRDSVGASLSRLLPWFKWSVGAAYSQENFYRASTLLTSVSRDLAKGNTTIAGGYTFSLNQPTLHPTPQIETQHQQNAFVSATQTLSRTTVAQVGAELSQINGFQNNPFLRANVNGTMVLGHVPDARTRQTYTVRLRQALPADTYLQAGYLYYQDDWQVRANSLNVGVSHHLGRVVTLSGAYRWYTQRGAFFFQPIYEGPVPRFFTADFRLEPFTSGLVTTGLTITPRSFLWLPTGTGWLLQYERYRADNGFEAGILSTGLRVPLPPK
jgi:hypothetical protein